MKRYIYSLLSFVFVLMLIINCAVPSGGEKR
jgi:hypothetical protein